MQELEINCINVAIQLGLFLGFSSTSGTEPSLLLSNKIVWSQDIKFFEEKKEGVEFGILRLLNGL